MRTLETGADMADPMRAEEAMPGLFELVAAAVAVAPRHLAKAALAHTSEEDWHKAAEAVAAEVVADVQRGAPVDGYFVDDEVLARLSETASNDRTAHNLAAAIVDDYMVVERTLSRQRGKS